jgi:hypothetical protein
MLVALCASSLVACSPTTYHAELRPGCHTLPHEALVAHAIDVKGALAHAGAHGVSTSVRNQTIDVRWHGPRFSFDEVREFAKVNSMEFWSVSYRGTLVTPSCA